MSNYQILLTSGVLAAVVSGIITMIGNLIKISLSKRTHKERIKYLILKNIYDDYMTDYNSLTNNEVNIPEEGSSLEEFSNYFTKNLLDVYKKSHDDFKTCKSIFKKIKVVLNRKVRIKLTKEIDYIEKLSLNLLATAIVDRMGGEELVKKSVIKVNSKVELIPIGNFEDSTREYIDKVQELKNHISVVMEKHLIKLLK